MRADMTVKSVLFVASLMLIACFAASVAEAADQTMGSGTQSQEGIGTPTIKDEPQIQREVQVPGELSKGHERPMKMPEWLKISPEDDYSHLLNLDFHGQDEGVVGRTKEEDAKHAVSF